MARTRDRFGKGQFTQTRAQSNAVTMTITKEIKGTILKWVRDILNSEVLSSFSEFRGVNKVERVSTTIITGCEESK